MRALKFRAWDESLKEMISWEDMLNDIELKHFILNQKSNVCPIEQFTNIKDSKGIDIYENDIIKYTQHHFNTDLLTTKYKIVEFYYDRWNIYATNAGESDIEVIGNIHENQDLLNNINLI